MPNATAVFKAVADFASLNREVDKTSAKLAALKAQAGDPAGSKDFESSLARMTKAQQDFRAENDRLVSSLEKSDAAVTSSSKNHTSALQGEEQAAKSKLGALQGLIGELENLIGSEEKASSSSDKHSDSLKRQQRESNNSKGFLASLSNELDNFSKKSNSAESSSLGLGKALLLLVLPAAPALIETLVGALASLGGALVAVAGYAAPAAGAIAAIGPAALAVAGAVGTAVLSFVGIGTALKALQTSESQAASQQSTDMNQAANAARSLANAEDSLRSAERARADAVQQNERDIANAEAEITQAQKQAKQAQDDLNAAREQAVRDLEDMKNSEIDARLSVESAEIALIDAQQNQAKVNATSTSTALDKRKADLQVAEAQQRLSEAQLDSTRATADNNKAQAAGVNGSPAVVSAQQQVTDAQVAQAKAVQNLADVRQQADERLISANDAVVHAQRALQAAQEEVTAAANKQTAANNTLAQSMAALSPAGQAFVYFLNSLLPVWHQLTGAAETSFLPGLQQAITSLLPMVNTVAIPTLQAFGAVLSKLAIDGAAELKSFSQDFVDFGTGAGPQLVDQFGHILLNLADALGNVTFAAVPLLQWLTQLTLQWSQHIKEVTAAARANGDLADFFNKVEDVLTVLGQTLWNILGILHQVFTAAAPVGESLMKSFRDATGSLDDYLHSADGFKNLQQYFKDLEPNVRIVLDLLGKIALAFLKAGASETTRAVLTAIRDQLVPAIQRLSDIIHQFAADAGKKFIDFLSTILDIISNLMGTGTGGGISAFFDVLNAIAKALDAITSVPGFATIADVLLAIAGGMKAIKAVGAITGLSTLAGGINALGGRAASYAAGQAAPTAKSATTFVSGVRAGATGSTATPRTLTARAGAAAGSAARSLVGLPPAQTTAASPTTTAGATTPVVSSGGGALRTGARVVGSVAAGIAGSVAGGMAGGAIGQAVGGDIGGSIGGVAGSILGGLAPQAISAGLEKIGPLANSAKSALAGVASTLTGAVTGAAKTAGSALSSAIGVALDVSGAVLKAAASYTKMGLEVLFAYGKQLLFAAGSAIVKGATAAWTAVQWLLNAALDANPITLVVIAIAALVAAIIWAWNNSQTFRDIVIACWNGIKDAVSAVWDKFLKPLFGLVVDTLHAIGDAATWLWNNAIVPAWNGIGSIIDGIYNRVIKPIVDAFIAAYHAIGDAVSWFWHNIIEPAWNAVGGVISGVYNGVIAPIINGFMGIVHAIGDAFTGTVNLIQQEWNRLGDIAKIPVNFVIDWVYNRGIVGLWNAIAGVFGLGKLNPLPLLAEGGVLPGYAPGVDSVPAVLSPGEGVLVPEAVRGLGADFVYQANAYFSGGRASGPARGNRFAVGGVVGDVTSALATMVTDPEGSIRRLFDSATSAVIPGSGTFHDMLTKIPGKFVDAAIEKAKAYAKAALDAAKNFITGGGGAGTEQWRGVGVQALQIAGQDPGNIGRLLMQMGTESGGNPTAINRYDVNWQNGTPSVGLMQVIGPTYSRYKDPAHDMPPYEYGVSEDPLSNILSSIHYTLAAYGSLAAGWQGHGYAQGGLVTRNGPDSVPARLSPGEFVLAPWVVDTIGADKLKRLNATGRGNAADLFDLVPRGSVSGFARGGLVGRDGHTTITNSTVNSSGSSKDITINTNIYNPVAEPASDSVASRMRTLSALGAFG